MFSTFYRQLPSLISTKAKPVNLVTTFRGYAKDDCAKALVDIPPSPDPVCPEPCEERRAKKKGGILHRIKFRITEGGTNFGTPFRRLYCQKEKVKEKKAESKKETMPATIDSKKALVTTSKRALPAVQDPPKGVQVTVLGADTLVGQYIALLLKQCPVISRLRLYEAKDTRSKDNQSRDLCQVVEDLRHINTNCRLQAFSCVCGDLERSLQNADIVLMLESGYISADMSLEKRLSYQGPIVKAYADAIALECPKAFVVVCTTPIDCMVPLIAEVLTLKETGWYDPRKLLGSLAVPEMRASTLAARALGLEPRYTRVPCVGGCEGESLVPLFSKAVDYFSFNQKNSEMLTNAVRQGSQEKGDGRTPVLSEAHALARLVTNIAQALLCNDTPRVTGFVETNASQVISPARYLAVNVLLNNRGICKQFDFPSNLTDFECCCLENALEKLQKNVEKSQVWRLANCDGPTGQVMKCWSCPQPRDNLGECASSI